MCTPEKNIQAAKYVKSVAPWWQSKAFHSQNESCKESKERHNEGLFNRDKSLKSLQMVDLESTPL